MHTLHLSRFLPAWVLAGLLPPALSTGAPTPGDGRLAAPETSRTGRPVFVCRSDGVPEFTDRPCGPSASVYTVEIPPPGPGRPAILEPTRPAASTLPRIAPAPVAVADPGEPAYCTTLRERLAKIDSQMRAGYPAREAARLWQRWRDAKARLRSQRC